MRLPCSAWELHSGMGARTRVVRGRRRDAQEIRPKIVHAHGTVRCRPTRHVGGLAESSWTLPEFLFMGFGQCERTARLAIVPPVGARSTGLVTARRALPGGSRRSCEGDLKTGRSGGRMARSRNRPAVPSTVVSRRFDAQTGPNHAEFANVSGGKVPWESGRCSQWRNATRC